MKIQPAYLPLSDLMSKRLFRIPEYQRAYSWQAKQRHDLFSDIENLTSKGDDATHFMATVVGLRRSVQTIGTDQFATLDIVDGQQRLTTLIILLNAISKALDEQDATQSLLKSELRRLLVKDDKHSLLLLQTNHDRSTHFVDYLRNGTVPDPKKATFLADRDLANAISDCEEFTAKYAASSGLLALATLLKNRLMFIFHEIEDEAAVYTVFEVLNSRGLDVAWLDRTKSAIMAVAFEATSAVDKTELIRELHTLWGSIYEIIGLRQGLSSEALRFGATLISPESLNRVAPEGEALDIIRAYCGATAKGAIKATKWLLNVVKAVDAVLTDRRRSAVTKIAHARLLAVSLMLSDLDATERDLALDQWERVTFRIFGMCRRDARTKVGEYVRLAQGIRKGKAPVKQLLKDLQALGNEEFSIENAVEEMVEVNCYHSWQEELRYFMARYEEHLAARANQSFKNEQWDRIWAASAAQSIEHIHPQTPSKGGPWQGALGKGRGQLEKHVHRLGNLVLLPPGLNSKLGNKGFDVKTKAYAQTGLFIAQEVAPKRKWRKNDIETREKALLAFARTEWADAR